MIELTASFFPHSLSPAKPHVLFLAFGEKHDRAHIGEIKHCVNRNNECIGCRRCEKICPQNALDIMDKDVSVSELMKIITLAA